MTGNVERFLTKTRREMYAAMYNDVVTKPFVLVTRTDGFGEVPPIIAGFLRNNDNWRWLRGVAVSGNRNFGGLYGKAGDIIAEKYGVPLLLRFELSGTDEDVRIFNEKYAELTARGAD